MTRKDLKGLPNTPDKHACHQKTNGLSGHSPTKMLNGTRMSGNIVMLNPSEQGLKEESTDIFESPKSKSEINNRSETILKDTPKQYLRNGEIQEDHLKNACELKQKCHILAHCGKISLEFENLCESQTSQPVPCVENHVESEYVISCKSDPSWIRHEEPSAWLLNPYFNSEKVSINEVGQDIAENVTIPTNSNTKDEKYAEGEVPQRKDAAKNEKESSSPQPEEDYNEEKTEDTLSSSRVADKVVPTPTSESDDSVKLQPNDTFTITQESVMGPSEQNISVVTKPTCKTHQLHNQQASQKGYSGSDSNGTEQESFTNKDVPDNDCCQNMWLINDHALQIQQRKPYFTETGHYLQFACCANHLAGHFACDKIRVYQNNSCEKLPTFTKDGGKMQSKVIIEGTLACSSIKADQDLTVPCDSHRKCALCWRSQHHDKTLTNIPNDVRCKTFLCQKTQAMPSFEAHQTFDEAIAEETEIYDRSASGKFQLAFLFLVVLFFSTFIKSTGCTVVGTDICVCSIECCANGEVVEYHNGDDPPGAVQQDARYVEVAPVDDLHYPEQEDYVYRYIKLILGLFLYVVCVLLQYWLTPEPVRYEDFDSIDIEDNDSTCSTDSRDNTDDTLDSSQLPGESLDGQSMAHVIRHQPPGAEAPLLMSGDDRCSLASGNPVLLQRTSDLPDSGYRGSSGNRTISVEVIFQEASKEFQVSPLESLGNVIQRVRKEALAMVGHPARLVIEMLEPHILSRHRRYGLKLQPGRNIESLSPEELHLSMDNVTGSCFLLTIYPDEVVFYRQHRRLPENMHDFLGGEHKHCSG